MPGSGLLSQERCQLLPVPDHSLQTAYAKHESAECRYQKATSVTKELAQRKARLNSEGYEAWTKARAAKDFSLFAPKLKEIVALTREIAQVTSPDKPLYDAALDNFEKGMTSERIDEVCLQPLFTTSLGLARAPRCPLQCTRCRPHHSPTLPLCECSSACSLQFSVTWSERCTLCHHHDARSP